MPDAEEAASVVMLSEGGGALHQEPVQRSGFTRIELVAPDIPAVRELTLTRFDCSAKRVAITSVIIRDAPKTVRQTKTARSKDHAGPVVQPFGQEIDAGLASVADISANVQKFVG